MAPATVKLKNPLTYLPRRLQLVVTFALVAVVTIIILSASPLGDEGQPLHTTKEQVQEVAGNIWNPFRVPVHAPPKQSNSSNEETSWLSDLKWMLPFSSSTTFEENRLVLPPEPTRVPVYTYYASNATKDTKFRDTEHELLLIWRRAWWAKGFKPIVLGEAEAKMNPHFRNLHNAKSSKLEHELMRWLAWGTMGTGVLTNWLALPMTEYEDPTLEFLRRGDFPHLSGYKGLADGIFTGKSSDIDKATEVALLADDFSSTDMVSHLGANIIHTDADHDAIAFYSMPTIQSKYGDIAKALRSSTEESRLEGMQALPNLINAHLHTIWQNTFSSGISVLKPNPDHMTVAVESATSLAQNLSWCSTSLLPTSCPPNKPKCKPCQRQHALHLQLTKAVRTVDAKTFLIGTVPHPYTFTALTHQLASPTVRYIRRKTNRDQYVTTITGGLTGVGINTFQQLVKLKELVASPGAQSKSIWMTAERKHDKHWREDLAWLFGFEIPDAKDVTGESKDPVPKEASEEEPEFAELWGARKPGEEDLEREQKILGHCRDITGTNSLRRSNKVIREATEAWNLADTELWRFVRAFNARRRLEREKWEKEEQGFAGTQTRAWGRWLDSESDDDSRM